MAANRWQRAIATFCACLVLTSCTTLQTVPVPSGTPPALPAIAVGDHVIVVTKSSQRKSFTVTAVEPDALVGKHERVAYTDMASLEVERFRKGATIVTVVAIVLAVLTVVAVHDTNEAIDEIFDPNP
jgi:hypothetical protein